MVPNNLMFFQFVLQTSTALEFVQNDLSEFVTTIQHDASVAIADSATAVNTSLKVRYSISLF